MTAANSTLPYQASRGALGRATLGAAAAAAVILTLVVLPAEWGIDPTGVGKALGLTRMAAGAEAEDAPDSATPQSAATQAPTQTLTIPAQVKENIEARTPLRSDEKTLTLAPHSGIEVKAHMAKGDHLIFRWTSTAPIRQDMHGEPSKGPAGAFSTYWKQKNLSEAQGSFTAPFDGTHGFYWRNGGETPVTITLKTSGFYKDLFEPPVE
ncbi:hypothetical protein LWE61_06680 [Sphingobium sufflavum]|uniref:hypothetical protein n=1 Tax=Sphingobium sufflavum TaxID=1129547 RepID=UPI001F23D6A3|nr:hypothetical protein [Sphingobium sufflavum]MCE7796245.1 hypothetical protein [Sphingobium sufflavum]